MIDAYMDNKTSQDCQKACFKAAVNLSEEIETIDPLPGCHQLIKYRALRCAEKGISLMSSKVQAIIVACEIPAYVIKFCKKYNIRYFEKTIKTACKSST